MFKRVSGILPVFKTAAQTLAANDALRMAGATAFFTSFALPPILMIIVRALGLFFDRRAVGRSILGKVGTVIGEAGKVQILAVIRSVRGYQFNWLATSLIFIFLLFVATTLFKVIKGSINQLWNIRITNKRNFRSIVIARAKATGIILFTGILFLAVMGVDMMQASLGRYLYEISPQVGAYVYGVVNHVVSYIVVSLWFLMIFRYLPDGRPQWSIALVGAAVTGMLFTVGKYLLRWLLSGVQNVYGTSGALVLILLFVFYSALILYYGAAFTKAWAHYCETDIMPLPHASGYHIEQVVE
jgi:membrane protein